MKLKIILASFYVLITGFLSAGNIQGIVLDANSKTPLIGATVYIHEYEMGVVTNDQGQFNIENIPSNSFNIQISFVGYETKVMKVSSADNIEVLLQETYIETPEVVVSGSNFGSQHENAVKIESINGQILTKVGAPTFVEALATVPGVDLVTKGNGIGKPVIRGLSNSNLLFLYDGIKLENYQFSENHPYVIDENGSDGVEIIKGPASILYGAEAIGGLINVLPEKTAPLGETNVDVSSQYHTNSSGVNSTFGIKQSTSKLSWGIRGGQKLHRDYLDGNGDFVPNTRFSSEAFSTFLNFNRAKGTYRLNYKFYHFEPGLLVPDATNEITLNKYSKKLWYQDLINHILQSKNTFYAGSIKMKANLAWQFNHRILNADEENEVNMQLSNLSLDYKLWIPVSENSTWIAGVQSAHRTNTNNNGLVHVLPNYVENEIALLTLYQFKIDSKLNLQAGARYDLRFLSVPEQAKSVHSHEKHQEETAHEEPEILEAFQKQYRNASFSVGGTFEVTHDLMFRANFSTAFRPPNVAELAQDGVHGSRYEEGNINLNSQRNYEGDASIHYHNKHWSVDVAGFYNTINKYIYLAPTDEIHEGYTVYQYMQSNALIRGGEVNVRYQPVVWIEFYEKLQVLRGNQKNGKNLPFIPHDKSNSGIRFEKPIFWKFKHLYLGIEWQHAFKQDRPSEFETATGFYSLVNLNLGGNLPIKNHQITCILNVQNLLNEVYYDHLSTLKELGFYNPGRNLSLNIQYKF